MRFVILAVVAFLVTGGRGGSADKKPKLPDNTSKLMAQKLKGAQTLLEALTTDDYDRMVKSSEELIRVSQASEWTAYKTHEYDLQTKRFRLAAELLIKKAKAKDLDGATLAYLDMTLTCVRCHQHCRENRNTNFDPPTLARE